MYETYTILRTTLQSHVVTAEFSKHDIRHNPSIAYIFVWFLIAYKISEPIQEITQMKKYIKGLSITSDQHHSRLKNL